MAKKPIETRDRYRLHAETSTEEFGGVLAQLTKMGLQNIGYELITDIPTFRTNKRPNGQDVTAEQVILEFIKQKPTFKASEIVAVLVEHGRPPGSAYQALGAMVKQNQLRKLQPGVYQDIAIGHLAGPASAEPAAPVKPKPTGRGGHHPRYDVPNRDFIVKWLGRKSRFEISALTKAFVDDGRQPTSASSVVTKMAHDGFLKNLGGGLWEVIKLPPLSKTKSSPRAPRDAAVTGVHHHG